MRRLLLAGLAAVTMGATAAPRPAHAYFYGGGLVAGTAVGLGVGALIGSAYARPYYPYPYATYAYPPAYYPPAYYPPAYYPPAYEASPPVAYTPAPQPAAPQPKCGPRQFFNTLTNHCDQ